MAVPVTLQGLLVERCCSYPLLRVRPPGEDEHEDAEDDERHGKQQVSGVGPEDAAGARRVHTSTAFTGTGAALAWRARRAAVR